MQCCMDNDGNGDGCNEQIEEEIRAKKQEEDDARQAAKEAAEQKAAEEQAAKEAAAAEAAAAKEAQHRSGRRTVHRCGL